MPRILIAEDDDNSRALLVKFLRRLGYEVLEAHNGGEAVEYASQADLILLDIMMPVLNGWEVAEIVRQDYPRLPILMLTALSSTTDQVQGLELGADDYVTKPYDFRALEARIKALLRRTGIRDELTFDALKILPGSREVYVAGHKVKLSKVEYELLIALARYPGQVLSRERLLERVWGPDYLGTDRVVDVRMVALRKKLDDDKDRYIETVRGLGYRFRKG